MIPHRWAATGFTAQLPQFAGCRTPAPTPPDNSSPQPLEWKCVPRKIRPNLIPIVTPVTAGDRCRREIDTRNYIGDSSDRGGFPLCRVLFVHCIIESVAAVTKYFKLLQTAQTGPHVIRNDNARVWQWAWDKSLPNSYIWNYKCKDHSDIQYIWNWVFSLSFIRHCTTVCMSRTTAVLSQTVDSLQALFLRKYLQP